MADMLSIPFVRKIFKRISGKTSFRDINNYLKTVEYNNELDPKRIEEFPLIRSHFCYYPCSCMILPIGEDEGLFLGLEKRGEGPIYGDFFYRLKNGTHHKHIAPIFLEKNYETPWDSNPVIGISKKMGFRFFRIDKNKIMEINFPPVEKIIQRNYELLVIHKSRIPELQRMLKNEKK